MRQEPSDSNRTKIIFSLVLLGILGLILIALFAFLFRGTRSQFSAPNTETPLLSTVFVPTQDCGNPTLLLGNNTFAIEMLQPDANGSFAIPTDTSGIAYWVNETNRNPVFVLSPMPENLITMSTVTVGSTANVTWSNCNSTTYSLSAPRQSSFDGSVLTDQSLEGITVFFQTDVSGAGFVFTGELTQEQIQTINTPEASKLQAEIGLLETTASEDGSTIRIGVSIQNYGATPIILERVDVTLTQSDGTPLSMISSEPPLPKEITTGALETIYFTFPRPASPTAALRVLTVEYDVEGY